MSQWPSTKARLVLAALLRIGWTVKRQSGTSHRVLSRPGWPDYVFAFHDREEIGPRMLKRIAKSDKILTGYATFILTGEMPRPKAPCLRAVQASAERALTRGSKLTLPIWASAIAASFPGEDVFFGPMVNPFSRHSLP